MSWKRIVFNLWAFLVVSSDAILCYNCTNLHDRHNYCEEAEIHNMAVVRCPNGSCISYDFRRVFISERVVNRTCLEFEEQCMFLRDSPGNSLRQCVVCSWDLCNRSAKLLPKNEFFTIAFFLISLLWLQ